jgi:ferrochelatase
VDGYQALVLVSFGGPEKPEEVMPFLRRVTAGRGIPEGRIENVAQHYYDVGGASPINARCRDLMAALRRELDGLGLALYWGNRNWDPLLADTVAQMRDDGVTRALAFVTSAYGGYSSCRQYLDDISGARAAVGAGAPEIAKLRLYYNHPGWVGPWASSLRAALDQAHRAGGGASARRDGGDDGSGAHGDEEVEVLFSAHSIPLSMARTSPYLEHVTETARLCAELAGVNSWRLVWQSRSGPPSSPWLGPDVCEVVQASTATSVLVAPIGFVCDNMEIVHDLDVEAAAAARERGARFIRASTVSTSPAFVGMVRQLVEERLSPDVPRAALGPSGPWPDLCPEGHCPGRNGAP